MFILILILAYRHTWICTYIQGLYIYICMYICLHVYVYMYVYRYIHTHAEMYICIFIVWCMITTVAEASIAGPPVADLLVAVGTDAIGVKDSDFNV